MSPTRVGVTKVGGKFRTLMVGHATEGKPHLREGSRHAARPSDPGPQLESRHFAALFLQLAQREAQRFGELLATRPDQQLLGRTEFDLRDPGSPIRGRLLDAAVDERKKGGYVGSSIVCPHCHSDADLKGLRPRTVLGLLGETGTLAATTTTARTAAGDGPRGTRPSAWTRPVRPRPPGRSSP